MNRLLKKRISALALGATALGGVAATPALARHDNGRHEGWYKHDRGDRDHDGDRDDRDRDRDRYDRRVVIVHRYDWDRPDPRYRGYYPNYYYRGGYRPIVVTRETRIYRGADNRYYCRRSDGTTGLIIGAAIGGILGDRIDRGRSSILGAVLGASAGGLLGREIDRGQIVCR